MTTTVSKSGDGKSKMIKPVNSSEYGVWMILVMLYYLHKRLLQHKHQGNKIMSEGTVSKKLLYLFNGLMDTTKGQQNIVRDEAVLKYYKATTWM
jgi:hypothetical protein